MESAKVNSGYVRSPPKVYPDDRDSLLKAIQNPLIVDEISKYISLVDMISCRSANSLWKNEWTPVIQKRSKFQLCFTNTTALLRKDARICRRESPDLVKRLDNAETKIRLNLLMRWISKNVHNFPCTKTISVGTQVFKSVDRSVQEDFFRAIASIVTELYLKQGTRHPSFYFKEVENSSMVYCNLTKLTIALCNDSQTQLENGLKFYQNLIQRAPNLETLSPNYTLGCMYDQDYFVFFTGCISALSNPKQLKTLHISRVKAKNLSEILSKCNLSLTELDLSFEYRFCFSSKILETFLNNQSKTLKQLRLYCHAYTTRSFEISFPLMTKLESLEIETSHGMRFPGLNVQQQFPTLKHLKMSGIRAGGISDWNQSVQPVYTLDELEFSSSYGNTNVLQIGRLFPNLKKLSIACEKHIISGLRSASMNLLEEFTLWRNSDGSMNEALTGIPVANWPEAFRLFEMQGVYPEGEPFAFLQNVKILRLRYGVITNLLCRLGPMKLKSLRCLDLSKSTKPHRISTRMLKIMRKRFEVLLPD